MSFSLGTNVSAVFGVNQVLRMGWTQSFIHQLLSAVGLILRAAPPEGVTAIGLGLDAATVHKGTPRGV
jgi:hypothetical protein